MPCWRRRCRLARAIAARSACAARRSEAKPSCIGSRDVAPARRGAGRRRAGLTPSREGLDDDHVPTAARA
jgi:hypothetical protein